MTSEELAKRLNRLPVYLRERKKEILAADMDPYLKRERLDELDRIGEQI